MAIALFSVPEENDTRGVRPREYQMPDPLQHSRPETAAGEIRRTGTKRDVWPIHAGRLADIRLPMLRPVPLAGIELETVSAASERCLAVELSLYQTRDRAEIDDEVSRRRISATSSQRYSKSDE